MKVEKTIDLGNGHLIEFGKATWDIGSVSIRNRYPTSTGGFSPRSSSEIPIQDIKVIVEESVKNGYIPDFELIEIAEICIKKLRIKTGINNGLSKAGKIDLMNQASNDPLFLSDLEGVMEDFNSADNENI